MTEVLLPDRPLYVVFLAHGAQPTITRPVYEKIREQKEGSEEKELSRYVSRQTLEELFGIRGHEVKVAHTPLRPGESPHKRDIEALQSFIAVYGAGDTAHPPQLKPRSWLDTLSGTLVLAGGPISNLLTRATMQYLCVDPKNPRQGLIAEIQKRYLDFQYHYLAAPVLYEAWAIYDRLQEKFFSPSPRTSANHDYQLITVVPNLFDLESFERGDKIIIFGAAHGIAQRGIEELLRSATLITVLKDATRNQPYWQALFEIRLHGDHVLPPTYLDARPVELRLQGRALFEAFTQWATDHRRELGIDSMASRNILLEDAGVGHPRQAGVTPPHQEGESVMSTPEEQTAKPTGAAPEAPELEEILARIDISIEEIRQIHAQTDWENEKTYRYPELVRNPPVGKEILD